MTGGDIVSTMSGMVGGGERGENSPVFTHLLDPWLVVDEDDLEGAADVDAVDDEVREDDDDGALGDLLVSSFLDLCLTSFL